MKIYKKMNKLNLTALFIVSCQFAFSAFAATVKSPQEDIYEGFTNLPEWDLTSPNFFENHEKEIKKNDYLIVLNLIKKEKFEQASNEITSLLNQTPDDANLYNLQALVNIKKGKKDSAKQNYQKALELDSNNSLTNLGLALLAFEEKQLDKAKDYADKVLIINDKNTQAYFLLADIATLQGNAQETEQILLTGLNKIQDNINGETMFITKLGLFYVSQKQPEKILPLSQEMVKRYPGNKLALSSLAGAQFVNNQKRLTAQTLRKIVQQDKKDVKHRLLLAKVLSEFPENEKEVLNLLDEAFQFNPARPEALIEKTVYLIKLQQYQQALDTANKLDELFPELANGKRFKGDIFVVEKKFNKALIAYQQAYQIKPHMTVLLVMADLMYISGKKTDAIKLLEQESAKYNNDQEINFKLATFYQQQANYKLAEKYYKAILTDQPDHALALNNLAWIYLLQKNPKAVKLAEQAYNIAPNNVAVADTYGYILVKQGNVEKGLKILQETAQTAPQLNDIQFHLAEAYSLTGKKQKAITILELLDKEAKLFPGKAEAKQLLMKLKAE